MKKVLLTAVFILLFVFQASASSIGMAPALKDMGTLERGNTYEVNFYITTDSSESFSVEPEYRPPLTSMWENYDRSYDFDPSKASQESISSWVNFRQDSFEVDPDNTRVIQLQNGGSARVNGKVTFDLTIPENAEPGYHAGAVDINPSFDGGDGNSVRTLGLTQFTFVFRVPGKAVRELKVNRIRGLRSGDDSARVDLMVQNTGTVTTTITDSDIQVINENGEEIGSVEATGKIKPGQIKVIRDVLRTDSQLEAGEYNVRGNLNYMTGKAIFQDSLAITDFIEIEQTDNTGNNTAEQQQSKSKLPTWLVVMSIILLGVIMYSFDIDPFWIVVIIGLVSISAFVLMTGLPVWLIAIALIMTLAVMYFGG